MKNTSTLSSTIGKLTLTIAFIFSTAFALRAQQIEVVIVASSHQNPKPAGDYRYVVEKLKNYNPDMVFGEYLSSEDNKAAIEDNYWGAGRDLKKRVYL